MVGYFGRLTRTGAWLALIGIVVLAASTTAGGATAPAPSRLTQAEAKIEATIFSFDGKEFTRTKTTLMTEEGKSAVNTTLAHDSPAYKALIQKRSFVGEVMLFGHSYQANYAPVMNASGKLTGALFVAVPK